MKNVRSVAVVTWSLWLACALALGGCFGGKKGPEPPKPAVLTLQANASADLNPDGAGRPSPLVVRLYALRDKAAFEGADFFALYEKDAQILAADLVKQEELLLQPGATISVTREYPPDVQFLAVMGGFRDVERASWRSVTPVLAGQKALLRIEAGAKSLSIEVEKK
ncbi:MAG TPA: type VI secretion system lipoprotein TssJ [Nevskiaceae bacterium]|nr:type VI secretion system lipoprotein TssJ [Nevskiaceae bacterium]